MTIVILLAQNVLSHVVLKHASAQLDKAVEDDCTR